jgi:hypothetical protein
MGGDGTGLYRFAMATLHIEHAITDLETWTAAFAALGDRRRQAGVSTETVRQPTGDPNYIMIDLEFPTAEQARRFLEFLEAQVWSIPASAPALVGSPQAKVLETIEL